MGGDFGRIFTPEGDFMGMDWAMGDKKEQKARASTKANEEGAMGNPAKDAEASIANAGAQAAASVDEKRRSIARSRTVYSNPLGLGTTANLAKKALLGQ